jgi:hypothetical protein
LLERAQYLQHCADQGMAQASVIQQANELLVIAQRLGWRQLLLPLTTIILAGLEPSSSVHHHGA